MFVPEKLKTFKVMEKLALWVLVFSVFALGLHSGADDQEMLQMSKLDSNSCLNYRNSERIDFMAHSKCDIELAHAYLRCV
jgi:hypothetical protein